MEQVGPLAAASVQPTAPDEGARRRLVVWSPELGAAPACSAAPHLLRRPRLASWALEGVVSR